MNQNVIEVKNLSKEYRKRPVLRNITMSIPCNCVYGLLGVNGTGQPARETRQRKIKSGSLSVAGFITPSVPFADRRFINMKSKPGSL